MEKYHYVFSCTKYARTRDELYNAFKIRNLNIVDTHVLLRDDVTLSNSVNKNLFTFSLKNLKVFFFDVLYFVALYLLNSAMSNFSNVCICLKYVTFYYAL